MPVDIARHVIVQMEGGNQANWRIDIWTQTVLNSVNYEKVYSAGESKLPLKKYSELMHYLLITLNDRFFVYYNRESTLGDLRLELPRDKTVDVGL